MKRNLIACNLRSLPPHLVNEAADRAVQINPGNVPTSQKLKRLRASRVLDPGILPPEKLAILTDRYWGAGGVNLGVSFLDITNPQLKSKILSFANKWGKYGNIKFSESRQGEVRIASTPGEGYWSYLGTDILSIDASAPTMNLDSFSLNTPDSEFDRVVCHEFGHTLGCPHEHQRKEILDLLDPEKTYVYFWNHDGWTRDVVDQQIFTPLDPNSIWETAQDATSIMCYQFSGECTKNGDPIPGGLIIDPLDGRLIGEKYPLLDGGDDGGGSASGVAVQLSYVQKGVLIRASDELHKARSIQLTQGGSGSLGQASTPPGRAYDQSLMSWHPVLKAVLGADAPQKPPKPPVTPPLPSQLGPFNAPSITFNNGVPVGGHAQLTLFQNGAYNFNGSFHDSGAPSYNLSFVWGVVSKSGVLHIFAHQGHMAGTFESGSRDTTWNKQDIDPSIAAGWADLAAGYHWQWTANVNLDLGAAINSIKAAISAVSTIVSIVGPILA